MSFSHLKNKKEVQMVDISKKKSTSREARAVAIVKFSYKTFKKIVSDDSPKGSIFNTAILAGTLAAKKTHELTKPTNKMNTAKKKTANKKTPPGGGPSPKESMKRLLPKVLGLSIFY